MNNQVSLEELENQITQLSLSDQLRLLSRISENLSNLSLEKLALKDNELKRQREEEANAIVALCKSAASRWKGKFDSVEDIRQIRKERDNQICQNRS